MKDNRGIHKALSMVLCCVMLLGLLPTTALAWTLRDVNDEVILNVDIRLDGQIVTFLWRYMGVHPSVELKMENK